MILKRVLECAAWDRDVSGLSLTWGTVPCPSKIIYLYLVLVQPQKTSWHDWNLVNWTLSINSYQILYGPRRKKTCLRGIRQSEIQTSMLRYINLLESWNFACSKFVYDTFQKCEKQRCWSDCADAQAWLHLCCSQTSEDRFQAQYYNIFNSTHLIIMSNGTSLSYQLDLTISILRAFGWLFSLWLSFWWIIL